MVVSQLQIVSYKILRPSGACLRVYPGLLRAINATPGLGSRLQHTSVAKPFAGDLFFAGYTLKATHRNQRSRSYPRGGNGYGQAEGGSSWRSRLDNIPSSYIFWSVAGLNIAVFGKWYLAKAQLEMNRDSRPFINMYRNFVVSWRNVVVEGRVWTMLTSCFSHNSLDHILFNGLSYYFMAPAVLTILGNTSFLALYLGGGLVSSATSLLYHDKNHFGSQGASGAIYAVISFFACRHPTATFLIFGLVPCPAWAFVGGIFAYDTYRSVTAAKTTTDTAGHVGGLVSGALYYLWRARFRSF